MASKGTRNTSIDFGGFALSVSMVKAKTSRDLKTEYVDDDGRKVTIGGGAAGGSRTPGPGVSKAVRVNDATVIRLPKGALDAIEQASKDAWGSMQVLECIDYRQVPTDRIEGSYWIQPAQGSAQGLYLLHHALASRQKVAIVKWVSTSREKLGVIRPRMVRDGHGGHDRALLLSELTFANDFAAPDEDVLSINDAEAMLQDHPDHLRMVTAARELVDAFTRGPGDIKHVDEASDTAVDARLALLERLQGEALTAGLEASTTSAVRDVVESLDRAAA